MYITKTKISYPVTLASDEALIKRTFSLFLNENDDNDYIDSLLISATRDREGFINQDIAYTSNIITLKDFTGSELVIPQGNYNSITSILNNDSSTLVTAYTTTKSYDNVIISFDPTLDTDLLAINFTTGWNNNSDVPQPIKQAIIFKALGMYDKTDIYDDICDSLCQQYKLL